MIGINDLLIVVIAVLICGYSSEAGVLNRVRRQSGSGNGEVIDNIFNIPITAIKQTAAAAQSLYPDGGSSIDSVFNIPVATLEAVGTLVKNRNTQRLQMDGSTEAQKNRRKDRRDRLQAHRKAQRLQHNDPLGVNALTDLFVGNHGLFNGHGFWGGHHNWLGDHLSSHFSGHGSSHGGHGNGDDDHDHVGDTEDGSSSSNGSGETDYDDNNGYEVTEAADEDRRGWGEWLNFGNWFGGQNSESPSRNQNKIAPRPDRRKYGRYDDQDAPLENKIAPKYAKTNYRENRYSEIPLENKIAPKNERRNYRRNYADSLYNQERVAPRRREGRDGFVFEHRSY